jgi:leader peptidase (prepilin peptidase)/N-methyltransferase
MEGRCDRIVVTTVLYVALLGVFGLVFGSFANVVIWRLPRGEALSNPPSHCPNCNTAIRWRDNVPVLSWVLLRGRCRDCSAPISPRYPLIEVASALAFMLAGYLYGVTPQAAFGIVFFYFLLLLTAIDIDTFRLPNVLVAVLAAIGLAGAVAAQVLGLSLVPLIGIESGALAEPLAAAVAGALIGAGMSLLIALVYRGFRGREGFGMGDVKLLGAMGLYLGPYVVVAFFLGSIVGAVWGIVAARRSGGGLAAKMPFGPFLALGGVLTAAFGEALWTGYLRVLGIT